VSTSSSSNSLYAKRGQQLDGRSDAGPTTIETKSIETVDNDQSLLLLMNSVGFARP
jgi:hypothetical protein